MIATSESLMPALRTTWQATVLAAVLAVALGLLRNRITARWRCWLWSLVLLRFLCVVVPASPSSARFHLVRIVEDAVEARATWPVLEKGFDPSATTECTARLKSASGWARATPFAEGELIAGAGP